jgi:exodeoxyribonuclease VII large subunit
MRLDKAVVERRIADGRRTLEALWRIAAQAHPNRPLEKGYVRVEDRDGHVLVAAAAARAAGRLRLVFGDGKVDAKVDAQLGPGSEGVERTRRPPYSAPKADQPKLL